MDRPDSEYIGGGAGERWFREYAETAPLAIVRAALKAHASTPGSEVEQVDSE